MRCCRGGVKKIHEQRRRSKHGRKMRGDADTVEENTQNTPSVPKVVNVQFVLLLN